MGNAPKTGTREWSEHSRNCATGCAHGCLYCYARTMALRYKRIVNGADWTNERVNAKAVAKGYRKVSGTVMFPTTHDITEKTVGPCVIVLRKLLEAGNRVLIVSKPDPDIFADVRGELEEWKDQVMFRFSIGTINHNHSDFWEPGAPPPMSRVRALAEAHCDGWQTSVSMEPLLSPWHVGMMINFVQGYVTGQIWIGKCRKIRQRCKWAFGRGHTQDDLYLDACITKLEEWQSDGHVIDIYNAHKGNPKIAWKDSYKEVFRRYGLDLSQNPSVHLPVRDNPVGAK